MSAANFNAALAAVLRHEGGYVNHPADPGGMTNLGVTKATWEVWVGREVSEAEMRALTPAAVTPLYRARYWDAVAADALPTGVDYVVFDPAVNSGPGRAARWLQDSVGVLIDGSIGPRTLAAARRMDPADLIDQVCDRRIRFLRGLPTWSTFGKGWDRRVREVKASALAMLETV